MVEMGESEIKEHASALIARLFGLCGVCYSIGGTSVVSRRLARHAMASPGKGFGRKDKIRNGMMLFAPRLRVVDGKIMSCHGWVPFKIANKGGIVLTSDEIDFAPSPIRFTVSILDELASALTTLAIMADLHFQRSPGDRADIFALRRERAAGVSIQISEAQDLVAPPAVAPWPMNPFRTEQVWFPVMMESHPDVMSRSELRAVFRHRASMWRGEESFKDRVQRIAGLMDVALSSPVSWVVMADIALNPEIDRQIMADRGKVEIFDLM